MIDLAVGVIIGVAFGAIVDSLVKDIITPIIGLFGGQPDFSAIKPAGIGIGNFLNNVISFLMKAAALYFFIVAAVQPFRRQIHGPSASRSGRTNAERETSRRDPRPAQGRKSLILRTVTALRVIRDSFRMTRRAFVVLPRATANHAPIIP